VPKPLPSPADKPPYHHGDLRRVLVEATLQLVEEKGVSAFTMTEVARRAGVSVAAPYRHFVDKDALVQAAATAGFDSLDRTLSAVASQPGDDHGAALAALAARYVEFALAAPAQFSLMYSAHLDTTRSPELQAAVERTEDVLARAVEALPCAAPTTPELAQGAWAIAHGVATLAVDGLLHATAGAGSSSAPRTASDLITAWVRGLCSPPTEHATPSVQPEAAAIL
jgi:AcrR family transcriptional regulator